MRRRDRLAGERLRAGDDAADLGMGQEQPQELSAGIAAGADYADLYYFDRPA